MTVVIAVLILFAVVAVAAAAVSARQRSSSAVSDDARRILDDRLAAGELTAEEYRTRVAVLSDRPSRSLPWITVGVPVAVLAAVGLLVWAAGATMGWGAWGDHDRVMGSHMGWSVASGDADEPVPGAAEVTVTATEMDFEPATIDVAAGEPVNITLINAGEVFHDLTIPALDFMLDAEPGQQVTGSLTVVEPGAYEYFCSVPGHASAGMRGTLQIQTASN